MQVRAKFQVIEKSVHAQHNGAAIEGGTVKLAPAYGTGNEEWSKYTPSGAISMQVTTPSAFEAFKIGAHYLVEFTPVE